MEKEILTVDEAAQYLALHPETVRIWAREKKLPGRKMGRSWRFRKADLDEWLSNNGEQED